MSDNPWNTPAQSAPAYGSDYASFTYQPVQHPPVQHPPVKRSHMRAIIACIVTLLIGAAIGLGAATQTANKQLAKCATALAKADIVMGYSREGMGIMAEAMQAAGHFDADTIRSKTAQLERLTPIVSGAVDDYIKAKVECVK